MTREETIRWLEGVVTGPGLIAAADPKLAMARRLDIIPLRDGSQTSLAAGPAYWPTSAGAHIPVDVGIRVVQEVAIENARHRRLLELLGVREAPVNEVRSLILSKHRDLGEITLIACKEHLAVLYLTHWHRHSDAELRGVYIVDHEFQPVRPCVEDVYLPGRAPFSPEELFSRLAVADPEDVSYSTSFVNAAFLEDVPSPPAELATYPTWTRWLCDSLGVLEHMRLVSRKGDDISHEFAQIAHQRPDLVLGTLEHIWKIQGRVASDKPELISKINRISVPCRMGDLRPLWETYIPFQHLRRRCLEFMKSSEPFPFLEFGFQPSMEELSGKWALLYRDLGVSKNDDLGLLLDILSYIQEANPNGLSPTRCHELVRLYCELEALCAESNEPDSSRDICRTFIEDINGIPIPELFGYDPQWVDPKACLWEVPLYMTTKISLRYVCEEILLCSPSDLATLSRFCSHTLHLPVLSWHDVAVELASMREKGLRDFSQVVRLYECMDKLVASGSEDRRQAFEQERLIAVYIDGHLDWAKRSQCLWSSPTNIVGRVALGDCYAGMESFFVNKLGIGRLTAGMVYDKLLEIGLETPPISEVGDTLELFSSLLRESQEQLDSGLLLRRCLFPVKYLDNTTKLASAEVDFAICDRQHLVEPFAGRAKMLDLDSGKASRLKPFFKWAGLERRYLSTLVTETTFVAGGRLQPVSDINRDIKKKAYALLRQTDAFNLYQYLRNIVVVEASGILSVHTLIQDGKIISSRATKSMLHMDEETGHLVIYVPDDKKAQDVCFATVLPEKLAEWLMGDSTLTKTDAIMVAIVESVLHYEGSISDQILQRQGIGYADLLTLNEQGQAVDDELDADDNDGASASVTSSIRRGQSEESFSR
ncbi:hypothetical protein Trco_006093 [Trichoderma cornu-damae]|uniref:Uncharacterized protein n=1 Tax=Trichoderma cornu-damae TaxID=654480 RepID=A0A9P8QK99_9HYPO|nr:hypothetical protein Trco_006093 [Trichoderma cornu-damae]